MHWKIKAKVQNAIAALPSSASYEIYYRLQRALGRFRRFNPIRRLTAGVETCTLMQRRGRHRERYSLRLGRGESLLFRYRIG